MRNDTHDQISSLIYNDRMPLVFATNRIASANCNSLNTSRKFKLQVHSSKWNTERFVWIMTLRLPVSLLFQHRSTCLRLQWHVELFSRYVTLPSTRAMKTLPPQSHNCSVSERLRTSPSFSRFVICRDFQEKDDRQFQLMDMPHVCGRDITRSINNWKSYLRIILKYDQDFRPSQFLMGAQQVKK